MSFGNIYFFLFLVQAFVDLLELMLAGMLATLRAQLLLSFCCGLAGALIHQVCQALN